MGAWSSAILGNDTSAEVYERFVELYNVGEEANKISTVVLDEQEENIQYDETNVWIGLALACWERNVLTEEIFSKVKTIIESGQDIEFNRNLDADEKFLKEREKILTTFLKKITTPRSKPRNRKKPPKEVVSQYLPGMCMSYQNNHGKYIGVYVIKSEHFRNKGEIKFCFLDFEIDYAPSIGDFRKARLFGLRKLGPEWRDHRYCGNVTNINYDTKEKKELFFRDTQVIFTIVGMLGVPIETWINNFRWGFMDLNDPRSVVNAMEKLRLFWKETEALSDITLSELLASEH